MADDDMGTMVETIDVVDLPAKPTVEDVVYSLRRILSKPLVKQVMIKGSQIHVLWKHVEGDTLDFDLPEAEPQHIIREMELETLEPEEDMSPLALVGRAVLTIEKKGLTVSHVVVGKNSLLLDWAGLPEGKYRKFMGGSIVQEPSYPSDVLIIVGATSSVASLQNALFGVKLEMDVVDGRN